MKKKAFTLAETLITLGIIGVVAALTIPNLITKMTDIQFRHMYKKAYADINQAFRQPIAEGELTRSSSTSIASTTEEFNIMKSAFKVVSACEPQNLDKCWADGDKIWRNSLPSKTYSKSFIDASGRSWAVYYYSENIYLVDTNGFSRPNKFGKDRFIFTFKDKNGSHANNSGDYKSIGTYLNDIKETSNDWCNYPPCYYESWLK